MTGNGLTYDESVDYICNEFKLATQGIYGPTEQSISYSDRPTKGAALALIARLRLFQASPLFNGGDAAACALAIGSAKATVPIT